MEQNQWKANVSPEGAIKLKDVPWTIWVLLLAVVASLIVAVFISMSSKSPAPAPEPRPVPTSSNMLVIDMPKEFGDLVAICDGKNRVYVRIVGQPVIIKDDPQCP